MINQKMMRKIFARCGAHAAQRGGADRCTPAPSLPRRYADTPFSFYFHFHFSIFISFHYCHDYRCAPGCATRRCAMTMLSPTDAAAIAARLLRCHIYDMPRDPFILHFFSPIIPPRYQTRLLCPPAIFMLLCFAERHYAATDISLRHYLPAIFFAIRHFCPFSCFRDYRYSPPTRRRAAMRCHQFARRALLFFSPYRCL